MYGGWYNSVLTRANFDIEVTEGGDQGDNVKFTIVGMGIDAKTWDDEFFFDTVEPGRINQCNFLCLRTLREAAEAWLNRTFNGLLMEFGADTCRRF